MVSACGQSRPFILPHISKLSAAELELAGGEEGSASKSRILHLSESPADQLGILVPSCAARRTHEAGARSGRHLQPARSPVAARHQEVHHVSAGVLARADSSRSSTASPKAADASTRSRAQDPGQDRPRLGTDRRPRRNRVSRLIATIPCCRPSRASCRKTQSRRYFVNCRRCSKTRFRSMRSTWIWHRRSGLLREKLAMTKKRLLDAGGKHPHEPRSRPRRGTTLPSSSLVHEPFCTGTQDGARHRPETNA